MREEVLEKHPEAVQELVNSLVASGRLIEEDPDKAAAIGAEFLNQTQEVIKKVLTEPADRIKTNELRPVCDDLCKMHDYMADKMNVLRTKIDVNDLVDTSYADAAGAS